MSKVLSLKNSPIPGRTLAQGWIPISASYKSSSPAILSFSNGRNAYATCIRCPDTPCASFNDRELSVGALTDFPADRSNRVCPTDAITINASDGAPKITSDLCIVCGVCAVRCPVGAISVHHEHGASINDQSNSAFVDMAIIDLAKHQRDRTLFLTTLSTGTLLAETDAVVDRVFGRISNVATIVGNQFPNILARSLLIAAGVSAAMGRAGNNFLRMDLIIQSGESAGVAEVEFGAQAVLDAPRDLLDSIAVLVSRYGWNRNALLPLIISDVLPNRRSEYWSIVQDVRSVFGITVQTVSVFALLIHIWNRQHLRFINGGSLYADRNTKSYRTEVLEPFLGRRLNLSVTPRPQIDIAK